MKRTVAERNDSFSGYVDFLLSPAQRYAVGIGCPMTASCSEVGRRGENASGRSADGPNGMAASVEEAQPANM